MTRRPITLSLDRQLSTELRELYQEACKLAPDDSDDWLEMVHVAEEMEARLDEERKMEPELEAVGATWVEPAAGLDDAHTDGNLVTAPAWPANAAWIGAFLVVLGQPVR